MAEHFDEMPLPTPYEREVLEIMAEECAEVIQRITKLLRFGKDEIQRGQPDTNAARLSFEVGDVQVMIELAIEAGLVLKSATHAGRVRKYAQLAKYMRNDPPAKADGAAAAMGLTAAEMEQQFAPRLARGSGDV